MSCGGRSAGRAPGRACGPGRRPATRRAVPPPWARRRTTSSSSNRGLDAALDELEWQRWLAAEPRGYALVARIVRDVVERDMVTEGQRQRILAAIDGAAHPM